MENQVNIKVKDCLTHKVVHSEDFNMYFDKIDGTTLMCGRTPREDPTMCKAGPIIADIEVTTICSGPLISMISITLEDNTVKTFALNDKVLTKRGVITAKELQDTDEII